ncbi:MAG TPA: PhzF family isomerase [Thermotogota bacterium]|nr:PhzF family isomerase [Thermotogota bacterium]
MKYNLYQVDSFTKELFRGNPAGVVSNADKMTEEQMQKIARELNNSETAFIIPSEDQGYDVQVRFFTPLKEVPICGHATIAAHYVRAVEGQFSKRTRVYQKTGAGILPVDIAPLEDSYRITMTQGKIEFGERLEGDDLRQLIKALNIRSDDLIEEAPVQIVSTGHSKVMIGLKDYETVHAMKPDYGRLTELSGKIGCNGYYVFTFDAAEEGTLITGRMFAPAIGINEDPVTGNANGPLGAYMVKYHLTALDKNCLKFKARQGVTIDRRGIIEVEVDIRENEPETVRVSGEAVIVFKTQIEI